MIFRENDTVKIVSGRKFLGKTKTVKRVFYKHVGGGIEIKYLRFTDGTQVQAKHCEMYIYREEKGIV